MDGKIYQREGEGRMKESKDNIILSCILEIRPCWEQQRWQLKDSRFKTIANDIIIT